MFPVLKSWTVLSLLVAPSMAAAQSLRGTTVERADSTPVSGVVMLLMDAEGRVQARALTNANGEFRLVPGAAGTYRVRTMRIGYQPVSSLPFVLRQGEEIEEIVRLSSIPLALDTVRVVTRSVCRALGDSSAAIATVWDQARAALAATQLSSGSRALKAVNERHYRTLDATNKRTLEQSSVLDSGYVQRVWRSLSADSLRRFGYVHDRPDGGRTYHAPDQDVLLSNEFVEDHCFRLATSQEPTLIGIAFEPTRERSRIPDIRGTLWLDRRSSELRRMEFRYVNTGARGINDAGGEIDYVRLTDGSWTIRRWDIQMPVLEKRPAPSLGIPGATPDFELKLREWRTSGGELLLLTRGRDTIWSKTSTVAALPAPPAPRADATAPTAPAATAAARSDSAVSLTPVDITARPPMLTEFEERRLNGIGQFLTRADVEKQHPRALPDILASLPGVRIARADGQAFVTSGRGTVTGTNERRQISSRIDRERAANRACYADVYLDGFPMYMGKAGETIFDVSSISPVNVEAIEFYASAALTPPKYSRMGAGQCGTLLIWTRKPGVR
jgi:hypothetical protein